MEDAAAWVPFMVSFMNETLHAGGGGVESGRASCSPAERALGLALLDAWSEWGYATRQEAFECAPLAFLGVIPISVLCWVRALRKYHAQPRAAFAAVAAGLALFFFETVRYRELLDFIGVPFPKQLGASSRAPARPPPSPARRRQHRGHPATCGRRGAHAAPHRLRAPGQARVALRRLRSPSHHSLSSAYEFNVFWWFGQYAPLVMVLTIAFQLAMLLCTAVGACLAPRFPAARRLHAAAFHPLALGSLLLLPSAAWHSGRVVPGAGDNLSGVAVLHAFAGQLAAATAAPDAPRYARLRPLLASTELVLLATSAEEAGLRGAKRYVAMHSAAHAALPTAVLVLEDTHDAAHVSVIAHEPSPGARHDPGLVRLALAAAARTGLAGVRAVSLPIGGTDAAAFSRAGVAAVALTAVDLSRLPPQYHTRLDQLRTVQPEALSKQLRLVLSMAEAVGRGEWEAAQAEAAAGASFAASEAEL